MNRPPLLALVVFVVSLPLFLIGLATIAGRSHPQRVVVVTPAPTVTVTATVTRPASRSHERAPLEVWRTWAQSAEARALRRCESGGDYSANTGNGFYGAYQATRAFLWSYGRLTPSGALHSSAGQDRAAYEGWLARGWQPWPVCGRGL